MTVELTEEERELRDRARAFGDEHVAPVAMEYVRSGEWPWEVYEAAADAGLVGVGFPERYGGRDASLLAECLVAQELCRADSSVGIAVHGGTIGCYVMAAFGDHDQKERWLEPVTRGEMTTAIALTEPETGSSLSGVSTVAEREGDEYVVTGEKTWVANGISADWVATLCRTDPDATGHEGLTFVVVPTDAAGYSAEPREKLGLDAAEHARIEYDGVRVPVEHRLGEEGAGFRQVLEWLEHGRVTIAAAHLGVGQGAFDRARAYAAEREQDGQPIAEYQGLRWKFADMRTGLATAEAQTHHAARVVDAADAEGEDAPPVDQHPTEQASIAKLHATEVACDVAEEAVQVFGGDGYDPAYEVEHFFRDAKVGTIYEGTSEVQRDTIAGAVFGDI